MDSLLKIVIVAKVVLAVVMVASCVTQERPREWSDNDWAKLSQAVGEMEKK